MKHILFLLSLLLFADTYPIFAQTSTLPNLPAATTTVDTDLMYLVRPGDAQPDRKITVDNLRTAMQLLLEIPRTTVAGLGPPTDLLVKIVTDGNSDCLVGGGSVTVLCQGNGTTWVTISGGGGGAANLNAGIAFTADVTPAQITSNQDNYTGCAVTTNAVCRVSTDASRQITGVAGGADGIFLILHNIGAFNAVLVDSATSTAANQFLIGANITIGPNQGIILQYDATSARWRAASGISGAGGQAGDDDLTAVAGMTCTGIAVRTGTSTWTCRQITGITGNILVSSNPGGVAGDIVLNLGTTAMQTDGDNTVTTGTQNNALATAWIAPSSAGSPTGEGSFNFNTTTKKPQMGNGTTTLVLAHEGGNIFSATSLANNGANCNPAVGTFGIGVDASGVCEGAQVALSSAGTPTPNTVVFPGMPFKDTRSFVPGSQGYTYIGAAAGGSFAPIIAEADGYVFISDGVNTVSPTGPDTIGIRGVNGIEFDVYNKSTAEFAQPANDGWEALSSNAGDTTQYLRVCGTITGGSLKGLACETIILNGTIFISSVTTTYANIFTVRLCTTAACVADATAAGTVTVREASGNVTIITLAPGVSKAAAQDTILGVIASTMDINGLTQTTTVSSANDKFSLYSVAAGANREARTTDIITTFEATYDPVHCSTTTATLVLNTVDANKPTANCSAGTTNTGLIRAKAVFPDSDGLFSVSGWFDLPETWLGTIDAKIRWSTALIVGNVIWQLQTACTTNGELDDKAFNTTQDIVDTAAGTTLHLNTVTQTGVTTTGCAAGEKFHWRLGRDRTHVSDTLGEAGTGTPDLDMVKFVGRRKLGT